MVAALHCCVVFKILKLHPDKIESAINLRDLPHKQVNLKYSSNDVQWNPKEGTVCVYTACECGVLQGDSRGLASWCAVRFTVTTVFA